MAVNSSSVSLTEKKSVKEQKRQPPKGVAKWWTSNWRAIFGELVSTTLLIFLGCMTCIPIEGSSVNMPLYSPIGFGLIVLIMAQSFGHISGCHLNPAVTLGAVILRKMTLPLGIGYVVAQCSGAIIGYGLLIGLSPVDILGDGICTNGPHARHTVYQTLSIEVIFTAALMVIISSLWDPVNEEKNETIPIKFGLTVTGLAMAGGPVGGISINPAKSLGPAVWTGRWNSHWVYWVGPLLGAATAAIVYKLIWLKRNYIKEEPILVRTDDSNEV